MEVLPWVAVLGFLMVLLVGILAWRNVNYSKLDHMKRDQRLNDLEIERMKLQNLQIMLGNTEQEKRLNAN